jgi:mannose-6-phosphate isomerase-like protein (cupin superfamily)
MHAANIDASESFITKDGSAIREVAGRVTLPSAHQSLAEATVPAGTSTDEHYHVVSEELYFFVSGAGRIRVDGEERDVVPGDCVVIPPGARHKLFNDAAADPLVLLCCCAPAYSHEDTIITEPGAAGA